MFKPRYLLVLLALAAVLAVGYVVRESEASSAASLLASAEHRLAGETPDYDAALRELDRALVMALEHDSSELAGEIFLVRGRTLVARGVLGKARADFTRVLQDYGLEDPDVTVEIGAIDLELGQHGAALATAAGVLAHDPTHPGALTLHGRALFETGELAMAQAIEIFEAVLPDRDTVKAIELAWRAATLEFDHPYRAAAISELGDLAENRGDLDGARSFLDAATGCMTQARASLTAALEREPNADAMAQLVVLLARGGNWIDAVDFGLAATAHQEVQLNVECLSALVTALDALERSQFAASILNAANSHVVMTEGMMWTWCRLLYEAEAWVPLESTCTFAIGMAANSGGDLLPTARFFRGFARVNTGRYEDAKSDFQWFIGSRFKRQPIPDAIGWAQYGLARCHAGLGETHMEMLALQRALEAAPRIGADVWERLAETQITQRVSTATAADSLMRAIDLAEPNERAALIARWEELSKAVMKDLDRTIEGAREQAQKKKLAVERNDERTPTWQFYAMGRDYLAMGNANGGMAAADAIFNRFPNHVLGMDLMLEARVMQHQWYRAADLLVRRASLHGPHPDTREIVRQIPAGLVPPDRYLELMKLDPRSTGLLEMVRELRAEGRDELAREGLASLAPKERTPEASLTLAELYAEDGLLPQALLTVGEVPPQSREYAAAIGLAFRIATDMKRPGFLDTMSPALVKGAERADLDPDDAERAALWLLAHDAVGGARGLLLALDAPETRDQRRLSSLALAQLAGDRIRLAEETMERAEAFGTAPDPLIARLAILSAAHRWAEVPAEVDRIREAMLEPSQVVDIALLALSERVREAALAAKGALDGNDPAPEWHVLLAAANTLLPEAERVRATPTDFDPDTGAFAFAFDAEGRDPREILVLLVALETPSGAAWVHREILGLANGGRVWPAWLMARAYDRLGLPKRATESVEALVRNVPEFTPGWDRLEADLLKAEGTRLAREYTAFVERRAAAGNAAPGDDPLADAIVLLIRDARGERVEKAIELLGRLGPGLSSSPLGSISAARVLRLAGARSQAVAAFSRALSLVPPGEASAVVDEFLALGTQAYLERQISPTAWRAELAALKTQLPRNPTVSLAWARFERQTAPDGSTGWDLARDEYRRFRAATDNASLDRLQPGSAAEWAEFFLSESPSEAEEMIRGELLLSPGSPDLWRLLGVALEHQGRTDEAFDQYAAVSNMLPDPTTLRRAAELLAQKGSNDHLLQLTVKRIVAVERPVDGDPSLELLQARSYANSGLQGIARAIPIFESLWPRREDLRSPRERLDLAQSYGVALLHRGDPADGPFLREVLGEVLPRVTDPLRRDMLQAYVNLSRWMPERPEPEERAAPARADRAGRGRDAASPGSDGSAAGSGGPETSADRRPGRAGDAGPPVRANRASMDGPSTDRPDSP